MSWLERLNETYEACFSQPQFSTDPLIPIDHVEQQAHIEITLDDAGTFLRASVVTKENTLVPVTEKSAGRTSGPVAHPLCDKLRYIAADYPSGDHHLYISQLRNWIGHSRHSKLEAGLRYVQQGNVVRDLVDAGVLTRVDGSLKTEWAESLSPLAKLLTPDQKTKRRDQGDAFVRWRIEVPGEPETAVWKDTVLQRE